MRDEFKYYSPPSDNTRTSAGTAAVAKPYSPQNGWKRVEIFWANNCKDSQDPKTWKIDDYQFPHFDAIKTIGAVNKNVIKFAPDLIGEKTSEGSKDPESFKSVIIDRLSTQEAKTEAEAIESIINKGKQLAEQQKLNGAICTAVSQWAIIEITTLKPIIPDDLSTYPDFHLWAFLQPLLIGDTPRMKKNMGFVVDDIPRSGWCELKLKWNYQLNPKLPPIPKFIRVKPGFVNEVYKPTEVLAGEHEGVSKNGEFLYRLVDDKRNEWKEGGKPCTRVQVKIKITIRNEETEHDRQRKVDLLMKEYGHKLQEKNNPNGQNKSYGPGNAQFENDLKKIERFETGSYIKVWVRNPNLPWHYHNAVVADDESEANMEGMEKVDRPNNEGDRIIKLYPVIPPNDGKEYFRPYSYRNHSWKRDRITLVKNSKADDSLYIVLVPQTVVDAIHKLVTPPKAEGETNKLLQYISIPSTFALLMAMLRKAKDNIKDEGKKEKFVSFVEMIKIPELAALFTVKGIPKTVPEFQEMKTEMADYIDRTQVDPFNSLNVDVSPDVKQFQFFCALFSTFQGLILNDIKFKDWYTTKRKNRKHGFFKIKKSDFKSELNLTGSNVFSVDFTLPIGASASHSRTKRIGGSKFPGYFAWLEWAFLMKYGLNVGGSLTVEMGENDLKISGDISPKSAFSANLEAGAIWSVRDFFKKGENAALWGVESAWKFEEFIKHILTWIDLKIGIGLEIKASGKLEIAVKMAYDKGQAKPGGLKISPSSSIGLKVDASMPIYGKASNLFVLQYGAMKCGLLNMTGCGLAFGYDGLYLGGKRVLAESNLRVNWGVADVFTNKTACFDLAIDSFIIGQTCRIGAECYKSTLKIEAEKPSTENRTALIERDNARLKKCDHSMFSAFLEGVSATNEKVKIFTDKNQRQFSRENPEVNPWLYAFINTGFTNADFEPGSGEVYSFVKHLLAGNSIPLRGVISYNGGADIATTSKSVKTEIKYLQPFITGMSSVFRQEGNTKTLTVTFGVENFAIAKLPLYLWLYECDWNGDDLWNNSGNPAGYILIGQLSMLKNGTSCLYKKSIPFDTFKNPGHSGGEKEFYWKISLDKKGDLCFKHDVGTGLKNKGLTFKVSV